MNYFGKIWFSVGGPMLAFGALCIFGLVANPPKGSTTVTVKCYSITKDEAVADEPGKFKWTCVQRIDE